MDINALKGLLSYSDDDKREAQGWGLLQGGLGILSNNTSRANGLQAISQGAMMGLQGYQDHLRQAKSRKLDDFKMQQLIDEISRKQRQQTALENDPTAPPEVKAGLIPYEDYWKIKNQPKELKEVKTLSYNGTDVPVAIYKDGTFKPAEGYGVPSDIKLQDVGGKLVAVDMRNLKVGESLEKSMTPDGAASNRVANSNFMLARDRFNWDKTQAGKPIFSAEAGGWITPPQAMESGSVLPVSMKGKPLTEVQGKATGFADRMNSAEKVMSDPKLADAQKPELGPSFFRSIPSVPLMGETGLGELIANSIESPERQQARQAQENWVRANLRLESGAVIGPVEMSKEISNYFPQLGDSPAVMKQKAINRLVAEQAVVKQAGPSYKPPSTTDLAELARLELERRQGR